MQLSFDNRTYLITGGGSGIGKGVAAALVASGANVMLMGRTADRLAAAADEIRAGGSGEVNCEAADITNEDDVARVVDAVVAWKGKLDGVVNSAGGSNTVGPITQLDSELWRGVIDLNVNGMMYVLKHSARAMVRGGGGSFIGISSIAASNTHRWFGAYGPAKSAVDHMVKLAADELGISGVRVNGIRPGLIRTELGRAEDGRPPLAHAPRSAGPLDHPCWRWSNPSFRRSERASCEPRAPSRSSRPATRSTRALPSIESPPAPETQGRPMPRATTAAWLVIPPRAVRMPFAACMP